jgi:hypothetical protein
VNRYDSSTDRLFNCMLVYHTPAGKRIHFRTKAIAPAADLAVELAERQLRSDRRRRVGSTVYTQAVQA